MPGIFHRLLIVVAVVGSPAVTLADTVEARCDIYPAGEDQVEVSLLCHFSQRQGYVHIVRSDGVEYDLTPLGDTPGNYLDSLGRSAYRESGLGKDGVIFRLADESIFVFWDTAGIPQPDTESAGEQTVWLAFSSDRTGGGDIYLVDSSGDGLRRLTTHEAEDGAPAWSPDGKTLLFESERDGDLMHIFAMNMDDGSIRRLTDKPYRHGTPRWSPDGSQIAYHSERQGSSQIFVMNIGTGEETQVSNIPGAEFLSATFSPDGFYLAAEGGSEAQKIDTNWGTAGAFQIWEFDLNNSKIPKRLTNLRAYNGYPAWSPSGYLIAFDSTVEGWADILTVDPDNGTVVNLTKSPSQNEFADWSWDGKQIAFVSNRDGNNEIYVMNADGTGARRITSHPGEDSAPSWSPAR